MKIAFDNQVFDLQRYGGISRYFCELASKLATLPGNDVSIVAPLYVNEYLRSICPSVHTTGRYLGHVKKSHRLARALNDRLAPWLIRRRQPDIVHRTYYAALPPIAGAATVITVYDMIHERMPDMPDDRHVWGKRESVRTADHVICISDSTRRDLIELYDTDPAKISVVHLGFALMPAPVVQVPGLSARPFILYVGQRSGYKNFDGLMRAYASSPRLQERFDIVCFGEPPFSTAEQTAIAAVCSRPDAVRQLGGSDGVLQQLYRQAAVFVYPSLYEGFGIPPLEAMSFNCPVVCCPVASLPEVVGDAAQFFDPAESDSLVAAIDRVTEDSDFRAGLVARGAKRLAQFSWERCAVQTEAIYRKVLI